MNEPTQDNFRYWNEEMVRKYNPEIFHGNSSFFVRYVAKKKTMIIHRMLDSQESDNLLDMGCGSGNNLEEITAGKIIGVDISSLMVKSAADKFRDRKNVRIVNASVERLPFPENKFNKIICSEVLEHALSPELAIQEAARVSSDSAIAIISFPNDKLVDVLKTVVFRLKLNRLFLSGYSMPGHMSHPWHLRKFTLSVINRHLSKDFDVLETHVVPCRILPLFYVLKCRRKSR